MASENVVTLSVDGAISRALDQNNDLSLTYMRISLAQRKYHEASGSLDRQKKLNDLNDLLNQADVQEKDITINTIKLFHSILIQQKQVLLQEDIINRLNRELDFKKKQIELGRDTLSSITVCEINISDAKSKLSDIKNTVQNSIMDLNIEMGDALDQKLNLKDEAIPEDTLDIKDLDELADDMVLKSYSVNSISRDLSTTLDEAKAASGTLKDQLNDSAIDLQNSLKDERVSVEYKVRSDYNTVQNKKDALTSKWLDFEKSSRLYGQAGIKYTLGMNTSIDYDRARQDMENSLYLYMLSKLDYYVETKKYKNFIAPAL